MMHLFNTLTKKKEELVPGKDNTIRMFVCGPTVYDYMHIGNARTLVFFDVLAKYLKYRGYNLAYIQNITDIDDKIIARAKEQGKDPLDFAHEWEKVFYEDAKALGITSPEYKRATDHIPEVINQVKRLIEKGHVYEIPHDGFYFDLSTFKDYGKLSGRTDIRDDDAVSRIDENENKRNKGDFCVWKGSLENGRPGWHIEDTAITEKYFGPQYEIHGGGIDLMFPHHEAEIAQQEAASGLMPFVKYWVHAGFLVNKSAKMSKSAGNFTTAHEALKKYSSTALRHYFMSAHYRSPLDASPSIIDSYQRANNSIAVFIRNMELKKSNNAFSGVLDGNLMNTITDSKAKILLALDDDVNVPEAIGLLSGLISTLYQNFDKIDFSVYQAFMDIAVLFRDVIGIIPQNIAEHIPADIEQLVHDRENLRKDKDFGNADALREQIQSHGYSIDDTPYGPLVQSTANPQVNN